MKKIIVLIFFSAKIFSMSSFTDDFRSQSNNMFGDINLIKTEINSMKYELQQTSSAIPKGFYLGQNYPNEYNKVTDIYFSLPESQNVKLVILNILGQQIKELINDRISAGTYKFSYDSNELPAGVYIYRLQTEDFNDSGKMLLVK